MNNILHLCREYTQFNYDEIKLPVGHSPEDIEKAWVKWDELHIVFKSGLKYTKQLHGSDINICYKRPNSITLHESDSEGMPDRSSEIRTFDTF